jgi:hypothetical protein
LESDAGVSSYVSLLETLDGLIAFINASLVGGISCIEGFVTGHENLGIGVHVGLVAHF